ncbi:MAG: RNA polymerase sigma factor [Saprospiraceae bacterium]|nr:RNA polymerase sigma factor [Lewinella sp.]
MPGGILGDQQHKGNQLRPVTHALTDWDDDQLMGELSRGRLACGAVLFERYHHKLINYFFRLCRRQDWSEDLVQITFERIIRYRHTFRDELPFRAWMYQIARSQLATYFKRHGRELGGIFGEDHRFGQEAPASARLEADEQAAHLQKALAHLPTEYREVLMLTRYQGLKYKEAGQVLGISEGAVKVKVYRAIQQLKELYFKIDKQ